METGIKSYIKNESKSNSKLYLYLKLITFFVIAVSLTSCDPCEPISNGGQGDEIIYFNSHGLSSGLSSVFSINEEGDNLTELMNDAEIYSAPSSNGSFAFLRTVDNIKKLYLYKSGNSPEVVELDLGFNDYNNAIISPGGDYTVFKAGKKELYAVDNATTALYEITSDLNTAVKASFSPDGRYIAFIKGNMAGEYSLEIRSTASQFINKVYSLDLADAEFDERDRYINWSGDSKVVTFAYKTPEVDKIIVAEPDGQLFNEIEISGLGAVNVSISPDKQFFAIEARNGNVFLRPIDETVYTKVIENIYDNEYYSNPRWTKKGSFILMDRIYTDDKTIKPDLILFDRKNELTILISSNATGGYFDNK